jgi:hypothetical protein
MNPLPAETLGQLARNTVEGFVESEQAFLDMMTKPPQHAARTTAAPKAPKPPRKRAAAARTKAAATVTA